VVWGGGDVGAGHERGGGFGACGERGFFFGMCGGRAVLQNPAKGNPGHGHVRKDSSETEPGPVARPARPLARRGGKPTENLALDESTRKTTGQLKEKKEETSLPAPPKPT